MNKEPTMTKNAEIAAKIADTCKRLGWAWTVRGGILTITKHIAPNNDDAFCEADMEYYSIIGNLPQRGGSDWGTDGGGVGALAAMRSGTFTMNRSGGRKAVLTALSRLA